MGIAGVSPLMKSEHVHTVDTASLADQIKMLEAQLPARLLRRLKGPPAVKEEDWVAA